MIKSQLKHLEGPVAKCACSREATLAKSKGTPRVAYCPACSVMTVETRIVKPTKMMKVNNKLVCKTVNKHCVSKRRMGTDGTD